MAGRRDVDGLLEEGPVQGSGLSNTASTSNAPHEQALDRDLGPRHEALDEQGLARVPKMARMRATPAAGLVASSTRMTPWLAARETGLTTHGYPISVAADGDVGPERRFGRPAGGARRRPGARAFEPCPW